MDIKEKILYILEKERTESVSGETLAGELHITRSAVWKIIKELRDEGHIIDAVKNRGYRLSAQSDILSAAGIKANLTRECGVYVYDSVSSTNTLAKKMCVEQKPPFIVAASAQTEGRGRRGRSFFSPKDTGVYFSVVVRPELTPEKSILLTTAAALATANAIEELCGKRADIKWINDVYVNGKKCAGILSEGIFDLETGGVDSVIVGIGINVSTVDFPEDIAHKAGSVGRVNRNKLVALCAQNLLKIVQNLPNIAYMDEYRAKCMVLGREITVVKPDGTEYSASAQSVDDEGHLIVKAGGETLTLSNEEVSTRL